MGKRFTEKAVVGFLAEACDHAGGQTEWAKCNGVSVQYVCDVLNGRRKPGRAICDALNLKRVKVYEPK